MAEAAATSPYLDPAAPPPRFAPGDAVRVRWADGPSHLRTPWVLRGRTGRIERLAGHFPNPEELTYRRPGLPRLALWRVRFAMTEVWGDAEATGDTLDAEIYDHWLEPVDAP